MFRSLNNCIFHEEDLDSHWKDNMRCVLQLLTTSTLNSKMAQEGNATYLLGGC
jgi:hypothetical protein